MNRETKETKKNPFSLCVNSIKLETIFTKAAVEQINALKNFFRSITKDNSSQN